MLSLIVTRCLQPCNNVENVATLYHTKFLQGRNFHMDIYKPTGKLLPHATLPARVNRK